MLEFYQQAGLRPDQIPNTRPPYSPTRAQDEYLATLGLSRAPTDRPLADTAWVVPTAVDGITQQTVLQPRTPTEISEGQSLRLRRQPGMGAPGQDSAVDMAGRAPGLLKRVGASLLESFNPFEDDISLRERGWRTLNIASLALPLGVGSRTLAAGVAKVLPALNGALQTRRGKIMLTSIAEAGVSGSIEAARGEEGQVVMGAIVGGLFGAGGSALLLRHGRKSVARATAQMADDFQNPDRYVNGGDNPFTTASDWAILTPQKVDDIGIMRLETTPADIRQASAKRGREQMEVMEAMLRERGFHPVYSQMDDGRDAWLVPGLPARDAANIARDFNAQKQVLTKVGLLDLETDMLRPLDLGRTRVGLELEPGVDQYVTVGVRGGAAWDAVKGGPARDIGQGSVFVSHAVDTAGEPVRFGWGKDLQKYVKDVPGHGAISDLFDETVVSRNLWERFAALDTRLVLSRVYRDTMDALHGASVLDDMVSATPTRGPGGAKGAAMLASGETRRVRDSMAKLLQLNNGKWSGAAEVAFRSGIRDWENPLQAFRPGGKGLFQTLEEYVPSSEMDLFQEYAAMRRWEMLEGQGWAQPLDLTQFPKAESRVLRYENALRELTNFQNDWIENTLVRTGVISREQFVAMRDAPENAIFVPLLRTKKGAMPRNLEEFDFWKMDLDDSGKTHAAKDPVRGLASTVHEDDKWSPWLEELMLRTGQYGRMAAQQEAYNALGRIARLNPAVFKDVLEPLAAAPTGIRQATIMGQGGIAQPLYKGEAGVFVRTVDTNAPGLAEHWYKVKGSMAGEGLVDALEFLGPSKVNAIGGAFGKFAALARAGTTISQDFVGKNISRDIIFAFAAAGTHPTAFLHGALEMTMASRFGRLISGTGTDMPNPSVRYKGSEEMRALPDELAGMDDLDWDDLPDFNDVPEDVLPDDKAELDALLDEWTEESPGGRWVEDQADLIDREEYDMLGRASNNDAEFNRMMGHPDEFDEYDNLPVVGRRLSFEVDVGDGASPRRLEVIYNDETKDGALNIPNMTARGDMGQKRLLYMLRQVRDQLRSEGIDIQTFSGHRITGANPGRDVPPIPVSKLDRAGPAPIEMTRHERARHLVDSFMASGAARAALVSMDRKYFRDLVHEAVGSGGVVRNVSSGLNPVKQLQAFSELVENTTRVGSFRQRMKQLNNEVARGNRAGLTSGDIADASAIFSRNASVDFALHGASALQQNVNASAAFFNATLQGSREMVEAVAADPMGTGFRMLAGITLPSTLLYLHNRKDKDYANLPAHERDLFWHIKRPAGLLGDDASDPSDDLWMRVAKPFEPGMLAGTFVEHFLEWVDREDPEFLDQATEEMGARLAGGYVPVPTAAQPWLETLANRSSLTEQPIIPRALQGVDARMHEGSEFANALARFMNEGEDDPEQLTSPLTIDNYVRSWTGQMGVMGSDIVDYTVDRYRDAVGEPAPRAERSLMQKLPLIRAFVSSFPSGAQSIGEAYSLADDARVATRTLAYLEESARLDDLQDYYMSEGVAENKAMAPVFERMTAKVSEMRKMRTLILQTPGMSPQEKRRALYEIDRGIMDYTSALVEAARGLGLRAEHPSPVPLAAARKLIGQVPAGS